MATSGAARIEPLEDHAETVRTSQDGERKSGKAVVELNGVTVSYGEGTREVLKGIDWTIREGERWHLQGSNGEH